MPNPNQTVARLAENGIIAVLRDVDREHIVPVARAVHDAGVVGIEVTADGEDVDEKIAGVASELSDTDAIVGAGTVLDAPTARSVIDAGAEFILAPNFNIDVVTACRDRDVVAGPGILTPSEAVSALDAGADVLKLFPATTVGPDHIAALRGPLGDVSIVPTGGITPENAPTYLDAGAIAVGAGSALVDYEAIENDDMDQVRETAATFVSAIDETR